MQMKADAGATKASATGIVKTVDVATGTMTISEDPVPSLNWPAMIMTFKATPAQLASVHAGQKVAFSFVSKGMDGTLTRIEPAK
ncbi:MAG: copper-binding protein [Proteobacteria bacterium]|nr:copper-binding protein [Pseudomonadota bacterium]MBS0461959.1 copper-binding protein [Pseudomonadota bacterium]MBS0463617.1 copper-binding protein [Pseudomonadota bacterium]